MDRPYQLESLSHAITRDGTVQQFNVAFCKTKTRTSGSQRCLNGRKRRVRDAPPFPITLLGSEFRPREDANLSEQRVRRPPKPSDRPEPFAVNESRSFHDVKLGIETNPLHLTEHQPTRVPKVHVSVEFALENRRTIGHVGRIHRVRFSHGQSSENKLITLGR